MPAQNWCVIYISYYRLRPPITPVSPDTIQRPEPCNSDRGSGHLGDAAHGTRQGSATGKGRKNKGLLGHLRPDQIAYDRPQHLDSGGDDHVYERLTRGLGAGGWLRLTFRESEFARSMSSVAHFVPSHAMLAASGN